MLQIRFVNNQILVVKHLYKFVISEYEYMKHIFELWMKDKIEERSSQLVRNLSSCEKKACELRGSFFYLICY